MDILSLQLAELAVQIDEHGISGVSEVPVLAAAVRDTHPVLAQVLMSSSDPEVARHRAFAVASGIVQAYDGERRDIVSKALDSAGVETLVLESVTDSRSFARAA